MELSLAEEKDINFKLEQELLNQHYQIIKSAGLVSIATAAVVIWSLHSKFSNTSLLLTWFLIMFFVHIVNYAVGSFCQKKLFDSDIWKGLLITRIAIFLSSLSWGSMGFLLISYNSQEQAIILFYLTLVSSCLAFGTLTDFIAAIIGITCSLVPFIGWQFYYSKLTVNNAPVQTGLTLILYMSFLLIVSFFGNRLVRKSTKLSFVNAKLSERLEKINNDLESRVEERTRELAFTLETVKHQANHDLLTDLPNQRYFNDSIEIFIKDSSLNGNRLAIFYLGLDGFKLINDSLTHAVGDNLLIEVAQRLIGKIPKYLVDVESNYIIARMMGDSFAIAVKANFLDNKEKLLELGKNILSIMDEYFVIDLIDNNASDNQVEKKLFKITISIGVSIYPIDGVDSKKLLMNAETAMYHAKEKGRNKLLLYSPDMNNNTLEKIKLKSDLWNALENNELVLNYHPFICLKTQKIIGVESLLRWNHRSKGLISPAVFIPLAEQDYQLIKMIDEWVVTTAAMQAKEWHKKGFSDLIVAVNLSFTHLNESFQSYAGKDIISFFSNLLEKIDVDPSLIEIELTESVASKHQEIAISVMNTLRGFGFKLALDDFGTGYSSLSYLQNFPAQLLKIDKSFIDNVVSDSKSREIISQFCELAHKFNMQVLAEGVETKDQVDLVKNLGCDFMQGFYFCKPSSVDVITKYLYENNQLS